MFLSAAKRNFGIAMIFLACLNGIARASVCPESSLLMVSVLEDSITVSTLNEKAFQLHNTSPRLTLSNSKAAIKLLDTKQDDIPFERSIAYKNMGLAFWRMAQYDSSLFYQLRAVEIARTIKSDSLEAKVISNMALVYLEKGQYALSLYNSFRALSVFEKLGDQLNQAIISNNIGVVYKLIGNFDEALNYFNRSIQLGRDIQNQLVICGNYSSLGHTYLFLNDFIKSNEFLSNGISYCGDVGNKYYLSQSHYFMGQLYEKQANYDSAEFHFKQALAIKDEIGDKKGLAATFNALARLNLDHQNIAVSKKLLDSSFKISTVSDLLFELKDYYSLRIRYDSLKQDYVSAFRNYGTFTKLKDSISNLSQVAEITDVISEYKNEALTKDRDLQAEMIKNQEIQTRFGYIILSLAGMVILILGYVVISKNRTNKQLKFLNDKTTHQKEELQAQSTALKKAEAETNRKNKKLNDAITKLQNAQQQLINAEKMASLGTLSAGIGHEINNPLNFIKGGIHAIREEMAHDALSEDQLNSFITIMENGVNRANSIVNSLLQFTSTSEKRDEPCHIHAIIDNCLVILNNKLSKRVSVKKDYIPGEIVTTGNGGRLHQAFLNILSNAEQAIPKRGTITIETRFDEERQFSISITDNGTGIEAKNLSKIMDPFFTTKSPGEGTGLGLSIAYRIIEEHGGEIIVQSKINEGSTFLVKLPVASK